MHHDRVNRRFPPGPSTALQAKGRKDRSVMHSAVVACRRWAAACAVIAGMGAGAASAAVVTYDIPFEVSLNFVERAVNSTTVLTDSAFVLGQLQRFTSSLGTLTDVQFGFTSTVSLQLEGGSSDAGSYYGAPYPSDVDFGAEQRAALTLGLFEPSGATSFTGSADVAGRCTALSNDSLAYCALQRAQTSSRIAALDLAAVAMDAFIGTDPINFFARVDTSHTFDCQKDAGESQSDLCFIGSGGNIETVWSGVTRVAYTYTPAGSPGTGVGGGGAGGGGTGGGSPGNTVPEPSSLALLALGGLGLLGASRKRGARTT